MYLVAYLNDSPPALNNARAFDSLRQIAQYNLERPFKFPLASEDPKWLKENAVVEAPRSIQSRTKRINSLGNAIIPDIAKAIFDSIINEERCGVHTQGMLETEQEPACLTLSKSGWINDSGATLTKLPSRGVMRCGKIYSSGRCDLLNISKKQYSGLYPTLIRKDGNNNMTCKSRLTRPGGLGGLVGKVMSVGVEKAVLTQGFANYS